MKFNYNRLKGKIIAENKNQTIVANELGMSITAFNKKINNRIPFKTEEYYKMINFLNIKPEEINDIFFTLDIN